MSDPYKKILYLGNLNDEVHYLLSFVGGCFNTVGFILLFHALIGYMTMNTLYGLFEFLNGHFDYISLYKISIVIIYIIVIFIQKMIIMLQKKRGVYKANSIAMNLLIKAIFFFLFFFLGHLLYVNGFINEPNLAVQGIVTLGLISIHTQNNHIKSGHPMAGSTSLMTGNYLQFSSFFSMSIFAADKNERLQYRKSAMHYFWVLFHFILGAVITIFLIPHFDFLSLILPLLVLFYLMFRVRGRSL